MTAFESRPDWTDAEVAAAVAAVPLWYHTIDLRPGIATSGWFDLRPILAQLPWPDIRGKRCLDIGTWDGCLAFYMEQAGASEVVATDLTDDAEWDFPPSVREGALAYLRSLNMKKGRGFEVAARALRSSVQKVEVNVYDLNPEQFGTFDVVVCGSLLLHLRDPFRALAAIRSVCSGVFMSCETIDEGLTLLHRRRPVTRLGPFADTQWHTPNLAGHRAMIGAAGFSIERTIRPYAIPLGGSHPAFSDKKRLLARRVVTGGTGIPHSAVLARPS